MRNVSLKSRTIKSLLNDIVFLRLYDFLIVSITSKSLRIVQNDLTPEKKELCLYDKQSS